MHIISFLFLCCSSLLLLSGCFSKKSESQFVQPIPVVTGSDNASGGAKVESGFLDQTGKQNTGTNMIFVDDKDFDPKKSEDKEIEDLINYIEKTVNE